MQGNWSGLYNGDWFGDSGDSPDYVIAGLTVAGAGVAVFSPIVNQPANQREIEWVYRTLMDKVREAKAERIKPAKKSARKKARNIEIEAAQLVQTGGNESRFYELMTLWLEQKPVIPPQYESFNAEQLFMAQVAIMIQRIQARDEEDALIVLLMS